MADIVLNRTRALKRLREKMGSPVRDLNSVIVGLSAVGKGIAKKPDELHVSWAPSDLRRAEIEARSFAVKAMMVSAYDALDHYLDELGTEPSPIADGRLKSILRKETQRALPTETLTDAAIKSFSENLSKKKGESDARRSLLREFTERYCGKSSRPSIRVRLAAINKYCKLIPVIAGSPPMPRESYFSCVELMIAWRNQLVHDPETDQLGSDALSILAADWEGLGKAHASIDVNAMIAAYQDRAAPTLKEISTLVSVFMKYVTAIDAVLLASSDPSEFFKQTVQYELSRSPDRVGILRQWASKNYADRMSKALNISSAHGFAPAGFDVKKGSYRGAKFGSAPLAFLGGKNLKDLADAFGFELAPKVLPTTRTR